MFGINISESILGPSICLFFNIIVMYDITNKIRKWQSTLVFLPEESHGQRNLASYSPWGHRVGHDWTTNTLLHFWCITSSLLEIFLPTFIKYILVNGHKFLYYHENTWFVSKKQTKNATLTDRQTYHLLCDIFKSLPYNLFLFFYMLCMCICI